MLHFVNQASAGGSFEPQILNPCILRSTTDRDVRNRNLLNLAATARPVVLPVTRVQTSPESANW